MREGGKRRLKSSFRREQKGARILRVADVCDSPPEVERGRRNRRFLCFLPSKEQVFDSMREKREGHDVLARSSTFRSRFLLSGICIRREAANYLLQIRR